MGASPSLYREEALSFKAIFLCTYIVPYTIPV